MSTCFLVLIEWDRFVQFPLVTVVYAKLRPQKSPENSKITQASINYPSSLDLYDPQKSWKVTMIWVTLVKVHYELLFRLSYIL